MNDTLRMFVRGMSTKVPSAAGAGAAALGAGAVVGAAGATYQNHFDTNLFFC
jgi:hypothetical protein